MSKKNLFGIAIVLIMLLPQLGVAQAAPASAAPTPAGKTGGVPTATAVALGILGVSTIR